MANFNQKNYRAAREAFQAAGRDERSEKYARQWIKYMDSEIKREQELQKDS